MTKEEQELLIHLARVTKTSVILTLDLLQEVVTHINDDELTKSFIARVESTRMAFQQEIGELLDEDLS